LISTSTKEGAVEAVKIGASDGKLTELREGKLEAGQEVIIDVVSTKK